MFFASLLKKSPDLLNCFPDGHDLIIHDLLILLFLHSTFAKDSLAYRRASALSIFQGLTDSELLEYQHDCYTILKQVSPLRMLSKCKLPMTISDSVISKLKDVAVGRDARAYYHARVLCDTLPVVADLQNLDVTVASAELQAARRLSESISS